MKKVILNCLPPFSTQFPSPPLSILKAWLTRYQVESSIVYWNLLFEKLQKDFVWNNPKVFDVSNDMALYVNYIIFKHKNKILYNGFKKMLEGFSPKYFNDNPSYYDEHIRSFAIKMDEIIDSTLSNIDINNTMLWGFSIKIDGWVAASIIADKIKQKAPNMPVVVGGINTKETAQAFLQNFPQFDIAVWGEGEMPLIEIVDVINSGINDYKNVSNIAYRENNFVIISEKRNRQFVNLSDEVIYPDYDDYFVQKKEKTGNTYAIIPIEGSRGCHWNKCKFCYLNTDYKYRLKSIAKICKEIKYMIEKHNIYEFDFLDNDFIGLDLNRTNELLDGLIAIKNEEPKFKIHAIEVITKGLTHTLIKKMHQAGILFAQIGYESTSQNLLSKIKKKNTFASNLFYIKFATKYHIPLYHVNVLTNMPDETVEDIMEATDNLRFLRFFLHPDKYKHGLGPVNVNTISKYFTQIKDERAFWIPTMPAYEFLKEYIDPKYHWDIFSYKKPFKHYQWETFKRIEKFYLDNKHTYAIETEKNITKYAEYNRGRKVFEFDMTEDSLHYKVLYHTNDKIMSIDDILLAVNDISEGREYTPEEISHVINTFFEKGILYCSPDYTEILSVIDL